MQIVLLNQDTDINNQLNGIKILGYSMLLLYNVINILRRNMIKDGPLKSAIEASKEGIIRQEYTVYRERNGMLVKETIVRKHKGDEFNYHDTSFIETLAEVK